MTALAVGLVLASAVVHAAWNAALKGHPDPEAAALAVVGGAALASALLALREPLPPAGAAAWILASGAVEAVYFVTLGRALAALPLGTAYGVSRGGGQLVTWPVSALLLGEPAGPLALAGAGLLVGGLLARAGTAGATPRGLAWAGGCALAIGAYPLTYQQGLRAGVPHALLFTGSLAVAWPLQLLLLGPGRGPRLRAALAGRGPALALAALGCAASFLLFLVALGTAGAGRASAVRNTSIAFATLFGAWAGEPLDRRAVLGAAAITVGAIAVSAG